MCIRDSKCIRMLTFLPLEQIDEMDHWKGEQLNKAKEILAYELTSMVHGAEAVSYTHLDVYKRQVLKWSRLCRSPGVMRRKFSSWPPAWKSTSRIPWQTPWCVLPRLSLIHI